MDFLLDLFVAHNSRFCQTRDSQFMSIAIEVDRLDVSRSVKKDNVKNNKLIFY